MRNYNHLYRGIPEIDMNTDMLEPLNKKCSRKVGESSTRQLHCQWKALFSKRYLPMHMISFHEQISSFLAESSWWTSRHWPSCVKLYVTYPGAKYIFRMKVISAVSRNACWHIVNYRPKITQMRCIWKYRLQNWGHFASLMHESIHTLCCEMWNQLNNLYTAMVATPRNGVHYSIHTMTHSIERQLEPRQLLWRQFITAFLHNRQGLLTHVAGSLRNGCGTHWSYNTHSWVVVNLFPILQEQPCKTIQYILQTRIKHNTFNNIKTLIFTV